MKSHYLFFLAGGLKHNDQVFEGLLFDYLRYFLKNVAVTKIKKNEKLDQQPSATFYPQGGNLVANIVKNNNREPLVLFTALALFPAINADENYFFYGNATRYQFTTTPYCPDINLDYDH